MAKGVKWIHGIPPTELSAIRNLITESDLIVETSPALPQN
jgi:hypothetical protein